MSAVSPTRPSRRAARRAIVDSDDDEEELSNTTKIPDDDEGDFEPEPEPVKSPKRQTRSGRQSTAAPVPAAASRPRGRQRKTPAPASIEPTELFDADQTIKPDPDPPVKKASPRKRKSAAPRASMASVPDLAPPTPKPSSSPEPSQILASPLADITTSSVNSQNLDDMQATVKPIKPMDTVLEKPMDIVLKSRTVTIPLAEDVTPKPRIVLTYLILNNFKSYAGRQEVGPFHASFSSVVGPNGSGKSNVIDSLLFVFGFRASKMRQGKISALIHNSAEHPNLDFCEVAVHFQEVMDQPGGGHEVIPDSEIIISRKAFKNNSSKYYINNKESNFTTVTTLLRDRGVDLDHKRFLILQGEVESIAQMKPKAANEHDDGLLEYLEDIIGTSKYKSPIEESATEVETLNDICMEKSGRVQHVEKEKNGLEDKKDKALAYVRDENELAIKSSALYQLFIQECNDNLSVTEEAINQMQSQLDTELEKHNGSEQIIKSLGKDYSRGNTEFAAQEKQTQSLVKELAKFEQERVKFDEKRKFLDDKRKKLEKTINNAETSSAEADETIEQCGEEIETRTQEIAELEEQVQAAEAELAKIREGLKGKTQAFSDQIATKQKSLEPWMEKINQKQSAIAVAESEMTILQEKANAGAVALEDLQAKIVSIEEGKAAKLEELKVCEAEKAEQLKEAESMESELRVLSEQEPKIRSKISNARQKADEARSSLSSTQTRGNVLAALMRMKESGRIDGFQGRLGNLGAIDQKYDVAVSTACGALDNFVTETVEAGQQCIEYLRKNNLGRGNFICLDKLRNRDLSPIQTPENAPRLFDLVKAKEERFLPAFYHAMQDTLVANDLAQANRIAYGARRWRVVTLAGELIDKSGTMSGGGSTVKKGLMSSKLVDDISNEQVAQLEGDRDKWETKFQEFQEYQRECETRLRKANEQIPRLETQMQKIGLEIDSATRNLADIQRRIKELSKAHQPSATDNNRVVALQKDIAKLNKEVEKLHGETSSVEEEIKALQDKIMEVGGERLRAQRSKVDAIKEEISSHNEETSNAEVRKAKAEKQKVKLEKDYAKATKELNAAIGDLEKLEGDINNQGERAEELQSQVEEAEEGLAAKKQELKALKTELDEKTAELNETRAVEIEMRNKLEENQKVLGENQKRLRYWDDKLSKLIIQNVDDLIGNRTSDAARRQTGGEEKPANDEDVEMSEAPPEDVDMTDASLEEADDDVESSPADITSGQPQDLPRYTPDELADMNKETLKGEIAALEEKTQSVNVDLAVLSEYRRRVEEHAARSSDLQSAITQRDTAKKRCDDLRRLRLEGFMEGFSAISLRLKEMYQMITMGGNAELELVDSLDPFSEGILFSVMPPKKSWKNISNLSGGEKTLSSLALVFALHHYKPTPLYVMDEIDAALDFRNVSIVANYIKERTKNAQFIVISLRNNMFELAARLVGVYKVNHMTKSVTIENRDFIAMMWRFLVPLVIRCAFALPAGVDETGSCTRDTLYTSLVDDGIDFCSSVVEAGHCGGEYSTPTQYATYNQTQISSQCECIVTEQSTTDSWIPSWTASYTVSGSMTIADPTAFPEPPISDSMTIADPTASSEAPVSDVSTRAFTAPMSSATEGPGTGASSISLTGGSVLTSVAVGGNRTRSGFTSSAPETTMGVPGGDGTRTSEIYTGTSSGLQPSRGDASGSTAGNATFMGSQGPASTGSSLKGSSLETSAVDLPTGLPGGPTVMSTTTDISFTATEAPEFPAANFTQVTRTAAVSKETCHSLARDPENDPTRRALLHNAALREQNVTIPFPYIESVDFESGGIDPLYLTIRDSGEALHYLDISNKSQIAVVDSQGNAILLDASGIHFSTRSCKYSVSIEIDNLYQQLASLAGVDCSTWAPEKRTENMDFRQVLNLHDQCGNPINRSLRPYPQLSVGDTACADVTVDEGIGRWEFDCTFPGSQSSSMKCQWAIKNDVVDFITTDPFGGACPDLSTVVTTLENYGQDIMNAESLRTELYNLGLNATQRGEADNAVASYAQLWEILQESFSTSRTKPPDARGALEEYINVYSRYRFLEGDICEDLHAGELPLKLNLIAGSTRIDALTTLSWAPEGTQTYNATVQDASKMACCSNGTVAVNDGETCAYPEDAIVAGSSCLCGTTVSGLSIAFEATECGNYGGKLRNTTVD
ncbi:hypothetical protein G7046_g1595 [Stylonectria norvegica]|nr:hypothetical protein G7046_g1595 [Stylonectria norvegica]